MTASDIAGSDWDDTFISRISINVLSRIPQVEPMKMNTGPITTERGARI